MIKAVANENVFNLGAKHIAFAINKEGFNDAGFAGYVSDNYWDELAECGEHEIGEVLSKSVDGITLHALVCHSLYEGWGDNQAQTIKDCFDKIEANGEPIASIAIGTGFVGKAQHAHFDEIVCGMHASDQNILLSTSYSMDNILDFYDMNKDMISSGPKR